MELAVRAGDHAGCGHLDDLTLEAPLVLTETGGTQLRLAVAEPDADGRRTFQVYSRPEQTAPDAPWTRHAEGVLAPDADDALDSGAADTAAVLGEWPPAGAVACAVDELYPGFDAIGLGYGAAFRNLRRAYRLGDEVFAEVALDEDRLAEAAPYGLHPALLDAALHAVALGEFFPDGPPGARLPFSWGGVRLYAAGAEALRVRMAPAGRDAVALTLWDGTGQPVLTVDSLVLRPLAAGAIAAAGTGPVAEALFRIDWAALTLPEAPPTTGGGWALLGADPLKTGAGLERAGLLDDPSAATHPDLDALGEAFDLAEALGEPVPETVLVSLAPDLAAPAAASAAHTAARNALELLQGWLADDRFAAARLAVVTRGAIATDPDEDVTDLAHAAVWGAGAFRAGRAPGPVRPGRPRRRGPLLPGPARRARHRRDPARPARRRRTGTPAGPRGPHAARGPDGGRHPCHRPRRHRPDHRGHRHPGRPPRPPPRHRARRTAPAAHQPPRSRRGRRRRTRRRADGAGRPGHLGRLRRGRPGRPGRAAGLRTGRAPADGRRAHRRCARRRHAHLAHPPSGSRGCCGPRPTRPGTCTS
ncbi:hypothetical protein GCM10020254_75230 [Streptomyces goshikiensis]